MAKAAPMVALLPFASPLAWVSTVLSRLTVRERLPARVLRPPVPIAASVSSKTKVIATTGVITRVEDPVASAPPSALVIASRSAVAESVSARPPVTTALSVTEARVWLSMIASAIEAPTPRLDPVTGSWSGRAVVSTFTVEFAVSARSPLFSATPAPAPLRSSASTVVLTIWIDSAPAKPTWEVAPTPDSACSAKVLPAFIVAFTATPPAAVRLPASSTAARTVASTRPKATATPTPVEPALVVRPSAVVVTLSVDVAARVKAPAVATLPVEEKIASVTGR